MAKTHAPLSVTRTERTFRVEREMPRDGVYSLRIHRENIHALEDGWVVSANQKTDSYNEPVTELAKRPALKKYLSACNKAKDIQDLIAAEASLYDDLVAEVEAEQIAKVANAVK